MLVIRSLLCRLRPPWKLLVAARSNWWSVTLPVAILARNKRKQLPTAAWPYTVAFTCCHVQLCLVFEQWPDHSLHSPLLAEAGRNLITLCLCRIMTPWSHTTRLSVKARAILFQTLQAKLFNGYCNGYKAASCRHSLCTRYMQQSFVSVSCTMAAQSCCACFCNWTRLTAWSRCHRLPP